MQSKNIEEISVQDITDAATVNRATFYDHYTDKYALLEAMVAGGFHILLHERNVTFDGTCPSAASAIILAPSHARAIEIVDLFAPEHLQITTRDARGDAYRVKHAGAIFIGPYTPVAAGDYLAGPSHVLPTSGTGRFFSGLSAESFRKRTSIVEFDRKALDALGQNIVDFALEEGFDGHAKSVSVRAEK